MEPQHWKAKQSDEQLAISVSLLRNMQIESVCVADLLMDLVSM